MENSKGYNKGKNKGNSISKKYSDRYNFVPLTKEVKRHTYEKKKEDNFFGVIEYTLETKSPLFIPNTSLDQTFNRNSLNENVNVEGHKSYDFFSYTDLKIEREKSKNNGKLKTFENYMFEPVIPGSEIRGMIRNIYETLTGSCMSSFNLTLQREEENGEKGELVDISEIVGNWRPCKSKASVCLACDLFGMVGDENISSRIRFSDLYVENGTERYNGSSKTNKQYYESIKTLEVLGKPAPANIDDEKYFENGEIKGRKFYWHRSTEQNKDGAQGKMNKTIRPVKEKIKFKGKLYFENISEEQLKRLILVLNCLGENNIWYKLGAAKPYGYGSVVTHIDKVITREIIYDEDSYMLSYDDSTEKLTKDLNSRKLFDVDEDIMNKFKKIHHPKGNPDIKR